MQVVNSQLISNKKVLLRYDIDVALECKAGSARRRRGSPKAAKCKVKEDYKLKAGLDTLHLCIENASKVIIIGHLGRPFATAEDERSGNPEDLSAKPIQEWFEKQLGKDVEFAENLEQTSSSTNKIVLLENIRFFHGEIPGAEYHASCTSKTCDVDFAKSLASLGDVYINEAFSSHNKGASTTIVPTLLPHFAGLHFVKEVETLLNVRNNPKKPFIAIMGGAKVEDKLPVIKVLAKKADAVLVGGKLVHELAGPVSSRSHRASSLDSSLRLRAGTPFSLPPALPRNVLVGKLNEDGFDIAEETTQSWRNLITNAAQIIWNGPLGKFEDPKYDQTKKVAEMILDSGAEIVIGGGDSVAALSQYELLEKSQTKAFVSVGGGAMLKLLADGTLPTIEVLE